jgi:ParB family transcriptional regulator, chromosome partitioning protein
MSDHALSPSHAAASPSAVPVTRFARLALTEIESRANVRTLFDAAQLQLLAASLREDGQLQPILVYRDDAQGKYIVLAGERRLRAARLGGLEALDCVVFPHRPNRSEIAIVQITENELREGLDPIEQAVGFQALMAANKWSARQVGERLHLAPSTITRALALLELPEALQAQVRERRLAPGIAREIARLPEDAGAALLQRVHAEGLTAGQTSRAVSQYLQPKKESKGRKARPGTTTYRVAGAEATLTPQRIVLVLTGAKKPRTVEQTIATLENLVVKLREDAAAAV